MRCSLSKVDRILRKKEPAVAEKITFPTRMPLGHPEAAERIAHRRSGSARNRARRKNESQEAGVRRRRKLPRVPDPTAKRKHRRSVAARRVPLVPRSRSKWKMVCHPNRSPGLFRRPRYQQVNRTVTEAVLKLPVVTIPVPVTVHRLASASAESLRDRKVDPIDPDRGPGRNPEAAAAVLPVRYLVPRAVRVLGPNPEAVPVRVQDHDPVVVPHPVRGLVPARAALRLRLYRGNPFPGQGPIKVRLVASVCFHRSVGIVF